jgi:hypothetical protein
MKLKLMSDNGCQVADWTLSSDVEVLKALANVLLDRDHNDRVGMQILDAIAESEPCGVCGHMGCDGEGSYDRDPDDGEDQMCNGEFYYE